MSRTPLTRSTFLSQSQNNRESFLNQISTLFDNFFDYNAKDFSPIQADFGHPKFNVYRCDESLSPGVFTDQKGTNLILDIFVPYVRKEDIEMDANESDNSISVSVRSHQDNRVSDNDYYVRQVPRSSFRRIFTFESQYPVYNASGDLRDGILKITIPYTKNTPNKATNTRKIKIG